MGVGECSLEKTIITCVNEDILDDQVNYLKKTMITSVKGIFEMTR